MEKQKCNPQVSAIDCPENMNSVEASPSKFATECVTFLEKIDEWKDQARINTKEICKKPQKLVGTEEGPSNEKEEEVVNTMKEKTAEGSSDFLQEMKKEIEEMKEKFVSQNQIIMDVKKENTNMKKQITDVKKELTGIQKDCTEAEEKYKKMITQFAEKLEKDTMTVKQDMMTVKQDIMVVITNKCDGVASDHEKDIKQGFDALETKLMVAIKGCFQKIAPQESKTPILYNRYENLESE